MARGAISFVDRMRAAHDCGGRDWRIRGSARRAVVKVVEMGFRRAKGRGMRGVFGGGGRCARGGVVVPVHKNWKNVKETIKETLKL